MIDRTLRVLAGVLLLAALAGARPAHAQEAHFALLRGRDTLVTETVTRAPGRMEGELMAPQGHITYSAEVAPDALVPRMEFAVTLPGQSDPAVRATVTFRGDSAVAEVKAQGVPPLQRFAPGQGALPYLNLSSGILEQLLMRARAGGGEKLTIPMLALENGSKLSVTVTRLGADSAVITLLPGLDVRVRTDSAGRLLGGSIPAQGVVIAREGEASAPLPPPPDYSAPAGASYVAEEVRVPTPRGYTLAGTLTLPKARAGRVPAVVMISGSGPEDRDEAMPVLPGYRPFRQIADTLSRRGVAVLRLDDRGVGGSGGDASQATSADFADDVRAALAYLRTRPEIDGQRLGLIGHSEGGLIAPMVAVTDSTVRAVVLMAGPAQVGREISLYQNRQAVENAPGLTAEQRDSLLATVPAKLDSMAERLPWFRFWLSYDPLPTARRLTVPVLILQGGSDHQVTPEQAKELATAIRAAGNSRVTERTFTGLDHLFLPDPEGTASPAHYATLPSKSLPDEVLGTIADWVSRVLSSAGRGR